MRKIFQLHSDFKTKANEDGSIEIEGFASTTEVDRDGDVITAGAWTKGGLDNFKKNPIILFNHNHLRPIGTATDITPGRKGLKIVARISKAAKDVIELIEDGVLKAFSVGFRIRDADFDKKTDIFRIKDVELFEISIVSVPSNQSAIFSLKKSFENEEEYTEFKRSFGDNSTPQDLVNKAKKQEPVMDEKELKAYAEQVAKDTADAVAEAVAKDRAEEKAKENAEKAAKEKAEKEAAAASERDKDVITAAVSGAQKLYEDLEAKMLESNEALEKTIKELQTEITEKSEEIVKMRNSKRHFGTSGGSDWTKEFGQDVDEAWLLGICAEKEWTDTKYGKEVIEKVNTMSGVQVPSADFEQQVMTNVERDIQLQLVLAPLFREIRMNAATMFLPILPDAGYAEFQSAQTASGSSPHGNLAERGDSYGSPFGGVDLTEKTLTTKKLISQSYLGDETEEDAIMPVLPLLRESMIRSHARGVENMILVGNHTDGAYGTGGASPNGLVKIADDDGGNAQVQAAGSYAAADTTTAANLLQLRVNMGKYGVDPEDVIYVVSLDVYYNLLQDAEFEDMNLVGDLATKVKGQIGMVYGSRVLIGSEFATKAASKFDAVAVNTRAFVIPRLRGFRVQSDEEVANQRRVLVMSQRLGFDEIVAGSSPNFHVVANQNKAA